MVRGITTLAGSRATMAAVWATVNDGLGCDSRGELIHFDLSNNVLGPWSWINIDFLFNALPTLQLLNLSFNPMLMLTSIDLTPLTQLTVLDLSNAPTPSTGANPSVPIPLVMPSPCNLQLFNFSKSFYIDLTGLKHCGQMHTFVMSNTVVWLDLSVIHSFPRLVYFDASASSVLSDSASAIVGGLSVSNPSLLYFDMSATDKLQFFNGGDVWPYFNSTSLQYLGFSNCRTLYTPDSGPVNVAWLLGLPSLRTLNISNLLTVRVNLASFMAAPLLETIVLTNTPVTMGTDLTPLYLLTHLRSLTLDSTGVNSALPSNVSAVWPRLEVLSVASCNIYGGLPDFRQLPALRILIVLQNALIGDISDDFAADSPLLSAIDIGQKSVAQGHLSASNFSIHSARLTLTSFALVVCAPRV